MMATSVAEKTDEPTQKDEPGFQSTQKDEPGVAKLKREYILVDYKPKVETEYLSQSTKDELEKEPKKTDASDASEPPAKRMKLKGRNKQRPRNKRIEAADKMCPTVIHGGNCSFGEKCKFSHNAAKFWAEKPDDIRDECYVFNLYGKCPFGLACRFAKKHITEDLKNVVNEELAAEKKKQDSIKNSLNKEVQQQLWRKKYDFSKSDSILRKIVPDYKNRFDKNKGKSEADGKKNKNDPVVNVELEIVPVSEEKKPSKPVVTPYERVCPSRASYMSTSNTATMSTMGTDPKSHPSQTTVSSSKPHSMDGKKDGQNWSDSVVSERSNKDIVRSTAATSETEATDDSTAPAEAEGKELSVTDKQEPTVTDKQEPTVTDKQEPTVTDKQEQAVSEKQDVSVTEKQEPNGEASCSDNISVEEDKEARLRDVEKKKIDFSDKLYLAPLTTVGNLPFRRICKRFGADITCGEMAVCTKLLLGQASEWALLKRHETEDLFGVQVCGGYPDSMTKCAQIINETMDVDFVDINCGCPIDLIFNKGEGCALMNRTTKFEQIVKGMKSVLDVPLTAKIRTGIYNDKNTAHTLMPQLRNWGIAACTLHGRSRVQRYTKVADWDYINECAKVAAPMPVFGNGDILSFQEANQRREETGVNGIMIARGALVKPWVFTEIKEQRTWDISSSERLDILKDYTNYGLEHWGSDQQGVENTRRFLLEWLSFLYRYIPVGLLERLPQKINEKPPYYSGRDDLETMMASPSCSDWIKISEMLLGPVPENFSFLPKHKANAYK